MVAYGRLLPRRDQIGADKIAVLKPGALDLELDEEKWKPLFRRHPLWTIGIDQAHDLGLIKSKVIVI
jgi:hypothetical protein